MNWVFESYREGDFDVLAELLHPDIVAVPATLLGTKRAYRGRADALKMLRERDSEYAYYQAEARTYTATPDGRVFAEGSFATSAPGEARERRKRSPGSARFETVWSCARSP
jgi:ketosteroid isomerase-like protein